MPIKDNREYRTAKPFEAIEKREEGNDKPSFLVVGYATTFNEPYVMYSYDGNDYYEEVDAKAFDDADMSDVIFQYDHAGMVYARQKNNTLQLEVDEHGLKVTADLSSTTASREMYEAIRTGLVSEMSFAFTVEEDKYNEKTRTRTITKINKLYDVSAVSIPANPATTISARSYFDGVIEKEKQELLEAEERKKQILKIKILTEV